MAFMEGPLSKWTNVMKGWQYRWFVLDENSGLLSYYTSKEKMMRGARRGCVRLLGAVIGIDDEDDSTFTITVDQKTFHFQARDAEEKEKWIEALENTIARHSLVASVQVESKPVPTMADFDKKLAQTDAYLQLLIDQVQALETRIDECPDETARQKYNVIKLTAESTIESIKQSIVIMQISKQNVCCDSPLINGPSFESLNEDHITLEVPSYKHSQGTSGSTTASEDSLNVDNPLSNPVMSAPMLVPSPLPASPLRGSTSLTSSNQVPDMSYSSSDDEDFFDAEEGAPSSASSHSHKVNGEADNPCDVADGDTPPPTPPVVIASKDDYFDELYDNVDDDELDSLDKHGSIITHLLSQVRIGMDLTKIVLPTFILEKRSLLEMYADFLAHPDLFVSITDHETPEARMVQTVRWYMSAFHAGRRSTVAKKPYNPILGETFLCHYDLPNEEPSAELVEDGPVKGATKNNVAFIAEQVSHHPPISAFYAEHYNKGISLDGYIWTKSKFLGLSIGVHMIGQAVVNLQKYDEDYTFTFPNGYGRSILTVPWVELGGKTQINCAKTGYYANVEFHTKPFYGGKKDRVTAEIFAPNEKKPFCTVQGEWNGVMYAKYTSGFNEVFVDTKNMPIIKKRVKPLDQQIEYESRRLWKDVTKSLKEKNVEQATAAKHFLEQRQREEAKDRKERKAKWETKNFQEVGEHWVYLEPLVNRLQSTPTSTTTATPCITPTSTEDNIINNNASNNNNNNNNQLS